MKNLKFLLFTLIAVFTIGFAFNVNAEDVTIVSNLDELNTAVSVGGNIKLSNDITGQVVIPSEKTVNLDLGGKTITAPNGKVAITNNGTLTIKGEGNVIADGNYAVSNHGTELTINGGSYYKTDPDATQSLIANGWHTASDNTSGSYSEMVINGGTFDGGSYTAIKNDSYGKMTINNGNVISTMNKSGIQGGLQEAGTSLTINGGTFDAGVYIQNLSSVADEVKTIKIDGGVFNKIVKAEAYNGTGTKASRVEMYLTKNAKYNNGFTVTNTYSPADTNAFVLKQFDVKEFGGALSLSGKDKDNKLPAVNLDNMSLKGGLTLSNVEESVISNSTIKGDITAGAVTLNNVKAKSLAFNAGSVVQNVNDSILVWVKTGTNVDTTTNIKNSTIGKIAPSTNGKTNMYITNLSLENVTVTNEINADVSNTNLATGEIILNGGTVNVKSLTAMNITIPEKSKIDLYFTATGVNDIDKILNSRTEDNTAVTTITLPEGYSLAEDGTVIKPIKDATISGTLPSYVYTGKSIEPVTVKFLNKTLVEGTDYTISYDKNTNVGTAEVTITGQGNYTGEINETFKIVARDISKMTVSGIANKTYNGKAQTQKVTVNGLSSKDYTVSYRNNINAGTATIIINGTGNYGGQIINKFKINKAANPMVQMLYL